METKRQESHTFIPMLLLLSLLTQSYASALHSTHVSSLNSSNKFQGKETNLDMGLWVEKIFNNRSNISKEISYSCAINNPYMAAGIQTLDSGGSVQHSSNMSHDLSKYLAAIIDDQMFISLYDEYVAAITEDQMLISEYSASLKVDSFRGLFIVSGITSVIGLAVFLIDLLYKKWHATS